MNRQPLFPCLLILVLSGAALRGQEIKVDARQISGTASRYLTGACIEDVNHEIYGGIYSQMIFGESFQEPAPSPAIAGFKRYAGRWLVRHGVVHIDAEDGPKLLSDRAAFADGTVRVELKFADRKPGNAGLILRVAKPAVGADRFIGYEVSLDPSQQRLVWARHRNNFEPIDNVPCEVPVGRWIALEVRLSGSVVDILVDGKSRLRQDDGDKSLPAGTVGLRGWQREASFRKLRVKTSKEVESLAFKPAEEVPEISGMWRALHRGTARGRFALTAEKPFAGTQSQQVTFTSGEGEWGLENQGLNRWGMNFVKDRPYEGYVWARADRPMTLFASLESRDGSRVHAEVKLKVESSSWQRIPFTLIPSAADSSGRFALKVKEASSVTLGHAFLQPGAWGRFKGLPVRRDVAEGLINQKITVLRYGGSMVNNREYRWKKMIGPRDRRPPYRGMWYRYSTNGWGIVDFMDFCEAAGFEYVPAFNMDESPQDMADFIEYARGPADSTWGRKRVADGHPAPYRLRYIELGNEERIDEPYAVRFEALARAIWAKDRDIIPVVGDFAYDHAIKDPMNFTGAASKITSLAGHAKILELARRFEREVWFDVHVWTEGPGASPSLKALASYIDALGKIAGRAKHKVVVFEYNSFNHDIRRALGNALATNWIERDGRVPIVTSANGLQPDKQNDNGWDQGLLFLNPSQVWLQPPGHVTQMLSRNHLPRVVKCRTIDAGSRLDAAATRSEDGKTLVLKVVNISDATITTSLEIAGFEPDSGSVTELSGPLHAVNTAEKPTAIVPRETRWKPQRKDGRLMHSFAPYSVTVIHWEGQLVK